VGVGVLRSDGAAVAVGLDGVVGLSLGIGAGEDEEPSGAEGTGVGLELGSSAMPT
jgi:hypothetical protein